MENIPSFLMCGKAEYMVNHSLDAPKGYNGMKVEYLVSVTQKGTELVTAATEKYKYLGISVKLHARTMVENEIFSRTLSTASDTPHTRVTLDATWRAVVAAGARIRPVKECKISNTAPV